MLCISAEANLILLSFVNLLDRGLFCKTLLAQALTLSKIYIWTGVIIRFCDYFSQSRYIRCYLRRKTDGSHRRSTVGLKYFASSNIFTCASIDGNSRFTNTLTSALLVPFQSTDVIDSGYFKKNQITIHDSIISTNRWRTGLVLKCYNINRRSRLKAHSNKLVVA